MLTLVAMTTLSAAPVTVLVKTMEIPDVALGEAAAQALATELSRYGLRCITQRDMAAQLTNQRQQQMMGSCAEDAGCEGDGRLLQETEVMISSSASADGDDLLVMVKVMRLVPFKSLHSVVGPMSRKNLNSDLAERAPELAAALRQSFGDDRVSATPTQDRPGVTPARGRCEAAPAAAIALAAGWLLARRRRRATSQV